MIRFSLPFVFVLIALIAPSALAQNFSYDYGSTAELRDVRKVYIYTGADMEVRQNIIKTLGKKLPHLLIADKPEDADVALVFGANVKTYLESISTTTNSQTTGTVTSGPFGDTATYNGQTTGHTDTSPTYRTVINGSGFVVKFSPEKRMRLLMDFKDAKSTIYERRPSTNFARAFIKAYQEANE